MFRTAPTAAAIVLALAAPALTTPAQAQTAAEVLLKASAAIAEARTGSADVTLSGEASEPFGKTMPAAEARIVWRRGEGESPAAIRITGEGADRRDNPPRRFDALYAGEEVTFLDHDRKQRVQRPRGNKDPRLAVTSYILPEEFTAAQPLSAMLDGTDLALEGERTLGDQACDVVLVTFPEPADPKEKRTYTQERWFIARSDAFPRRIEKIAKWPMIGSITMITEFSNVQLNPALGEADLEMEAPEGFTDAAGRPAAVRPSAVRPDDQGQDQADPAQPSQTRAEPSRFPASPPFEITDDAGRTYTPATQAGRVTVLYFWGTWCIPCRQYSPLVSELAAAFADGPVDVLGVAVREHNPDNARAFMREKDYRQTLAFAPEGLTNDFRVRVYPTIVVIGPDNTTRLVARPEGSAEPAEVMAQVTAAVEEALPGGG